MACNRLIRSLSNKIVASFAAARGSVMELAALGLFAAALVVNSGSPGPSVAALVARVISGGLMSVMPFLAAMWIGEALWLVAAVLGLGFIAQQFYVAFSVIKYLGVAYLLYLAWKMWTAPADIRAADLPRSRSPLNMFLTGMALTLGNPKIMVFYLALLPTLIDLQSVGSLGLAELVAVAVAVMMATDLTWAFTASIARRWLRSPRAVRIANRSSAAAMGGAAVLIATR
jgi:threonine/homoserine/homoserine lactone efflux protein